MKKENLLKYGALTLILSFGLLSFSCNSKNEEPITQEQTDSEVAEPTDEAILGVNDFKLSDENGNDFTTESLRGKVVFINFWATWCPPCIREMPSIQKLKESYAGNDDIVFLLVDVDRKMEKSKAFMEKNNFNLPVSIPKSAIPSTLLGNAIPTTVIFDKNGQIAQRLEGSYDYSQPSVKEELDKLIQQN